MNILFRVQKDKLLCTCVPVLPMASPLSENKNERDVGQTYYSVIKINHHHSCILHRTKLCHHLRKENNGRERKVKAVGHKMCQLNREYCGDEWSKERIGP